MMGNAGEREHQFTGTIAVAVAVFVGSVLVPALVEIAGPPLTVKDCESDQDCGRISRADRYWYKE